MREKMCLQVLLAKSREDSSITWKWNKWLKRLKLSWKQWAMFRPLLLVQHTWSMWDPCLRWDTCLDNRVESHSFLIQNADWQDLLEIPDLHLLCSAHFVSYLTCYRKEDFEPSNLVSFTLEFKKFLCWYKKHLEATEELRWMCSRGEKSINSS